MSPKEFQKSNLAVELKTGKKRLEDALHGLSDEQCERGGATRSGSVLDLVSEIVTAEFLVLMEVSDRLPSLPTNILTGDGSAPAPSRTESLAANRSVENLLGEFGVLRSAVIGRFEDRKLQGASIDVRHARVADVCVTRFSEAVEEIERWRRSEIVGFSAARLRAEACESELNQAIVDLSRESLFTLSFDGFYSGDLVLWLGTEETNGKAAAFQHMADMLEPINTLLEVGMASILSLRATASAQDAEGNFITDWETVLGGAYATGRAIRWRTVRAWKSRRVIAERIESLPSPER